MEQIENRFYFPPNLEKINRILEFRSKLGDRFPKFAVFIVAYNAEKTIKPVIRRIPDTIMDLLEEVYVFDDFSSDCTSQVGRIIKSETGSAKLNIYRNLRNYGYGGNQKIGYNHAIQQGYDHVILLHGDGQYAPEYLPDLILPVLEQGAKVVFGSRMMNKGQALYGGMPLYKFIGNRILTAFENCILDLNLTEFHSGYRLYATEVLEQINYNLNTDDFHFDTQIIIQCRALGVQIHEVSIPTYYGDEICHVNGLKYALDVVLSVLDYRLHQIGVTRKARYQINRAPHYTFKQHRYSSHNQIINLIEPNSKVLDLGCSYGTLAKPLKQKGCWIAGVDIHEPALDAQVMDEYCCKNLEEPLNLPFDREFDYVLLADVLEHLRNADSLLKEVPRYLAEDGKVIASTGNVALWYVRLMLMLGRFEYRDKGILDRTTLHLYTVSTFRDVFTALGYRVVSERVTPIPFELVFESTGNNSVIDFITDIYYAVTRIWPKMFAYQTIIEAKYSSLTVQELKTQRKFPIFEHYA